MLNLEKNNLISLNFLVSGILNYGIFSSGKYMQKNIKFFLIILCIFSTIEIYAQDNQTLVYAEFGSIETLDTITCTQNSELRICEFLFDSLVCQNYDGTLGLSLAKDLDISPDGLSYTFILNDNLFWSDGVPLTTLDIEFTLAILMNPQTDQCNTILMRYVEDVECINPKRISINLSQPFFNPLSLFTFKLLPKHKIQQPILKYGNDFGKNPIGCGPFRYQAWKNNQIILERNSNYYRRKAFINNIIINIYSDRKVAFEALLQEKIHIIPEISIEEIISLEKNSQIKIYNSQNPIPETPKKKLGVSETSSEFCPIIHFIAFNHHTENSFYTLFKDIKFRRAILQAIEREKIWNTLFYFHASKNKQISLVLPGPFPIGSWANDPSIIPLKYDLDYSRQLLRESLLPKGYQEINGMWTKPEFGVLEISLKYPQEQETVAKACFQIAENLKKLGISIKLEQREQSLLRKEAYHNFQFDLLYETYNFDGTLNLFPLFDPNAIKSGQSNFSGYVDSRLVELFYELQNSLNPGSIRSISQKIHRYLVEVNPHLFLWQPNLYTAYHKNLKNFSLNSKHIFLKPANWKISQN